MSTTQCLVKTRQPESITSLVARIPVKEGQKLLQIDEVLGLSWEVFQGLSWTVLREGSVSK
ncbi:MAG: hypothetical protein EA442_06020 [Candidatus Nitrosopelagicus sp.]|nr:MAG: hypothetical protein EA442_06020 [Candidatus Nitrosopelagicus sp.]